MKNKAKILSFMLAAGMLLSGCSSGGVVSEESSGTAVQKQTGGSYSAGNVTAGEIKEKFGEKDSDIMPLYNVAPDEKFDFEFSCDMTDISIGEDIVTIHTDKSCDKKSMLYTLTTFSDGENGTVVTVASAGGVMLTDSQIDDGIENDHYVWGNAPMYYIALHYDTEAKTPTRLKEPITVPFTVKSEVAVPNAGGAVDASGRFKLVWDAVDGAKSYNIYRLSDESQCTGVSNNKVAGASNAYSDSSLILYDTTTDTEYDNFAGESHGLAVHTRSVSEKEYVIGQNFCVCGEFYVSAVVNGKESGLGAGVETAELKLPYLPTEEDDIMLDTFSDVKQLPLTLDIINIDGSVTPRNVRYTFQWERTWLDTETPEYFYEVEGTALTGSVSMCDVEDWESLPKTLGGFSSAGNAAPENDIDKTPSPEVSTIITIEETNVNMPLVSQQRLNTAAHIESGNLATVETPEENVMIFADNAAEEWLALNLINGETEISLEAFPELQNADTLVDAAYKVYYQNPYILGLYRLGYDYSKMTLKAYYNYDKDTIKKMRSQISDEAESIISQTIREDMTDEEKRQALYLYLENNCTYDDTALEAARECGYVKQRDFAYENSFNTYGIITQKKGVCQSYAYAYKLLCSMCGIDCKVCTGYLDGNLPHAWNVVNIDGNWYQTDTTNNGKTSGIPYYLYNSGSSTSEKTGFSADNFFETDDMVPQYFTDNDTYEYYYANNLSASTMDEYKKILSNEIDNGKVNICIRYLGEKVKSEDFVKLVREVYYRHGEEEKLDTMGYKITSGFISLEQK